METHWLLNQPYSKTKRLFILNPLSILGEFIDGSFLAQISNPDMKLPILYALSGPKEFIRN